MDFHKTARLLDMIGPTATQQVTPPESAYHCHFFFAAVKTDGHQRSKTKEEQALWIEK
ncbi:MAG: hypothetical protein ACOX0U_00820 [Oscillospiraceae bacterium]|jgi:hypothetical protein